MALLKIPLAPNRGTIFEYRGIEIKFSSLRLHPYLGDEGAYVMDISWLEGTVEHSVHGIVLTAGVNLVAQYRTPLPTLFAMDGNNPKGTILSPEDLQMYIKDDQ